MTNPGKQIEAIMLMLTASEAVPDLSPEKWIIQHGLQRMSPEEIKYLFYAIARIVDPDVRRFTSNKIPYQL